MRNFVFKMMNCAGECERRKWKDSPGPRAHERKRSHGETSAQNDGFSTENDGFSTENDGICTKNDGFCTKYDGIRR